MLSVYYCQHCIGFVLSLGRDGFEAFDAEQQTLGLFPTRNEAATALLGCHHE
jgi:hypothetical protein